MDLGLRSFPLSLNPIRQKERALSQRNVPGNAAQQQRQINGGNVDSQLANLKNCISSYLESVQMVCQAGTRLAENFSFLLNDSPCAPTALAMKSQFSKMWQLSISTAFQAKKDLSSILMELSLPDTSCNNQIQAIQDCRNNNAKVLEKCIYCLSEVHNSFFKFELDIKVDLQSKPPLQDSDNKKTDSVSTPPSVYGRKVDYTAEWEKLLDLRCNTKSWLALKDKNKCLRKYNGLTEMEIQNLVKHGSVSQLYLAKLNQRIDTALRNYEVGLKGLSSEFIVVFGSFHSDPKAAKNALFGCCSQMEMEQGTQRLPVSQFLHCELPLMAVTINKKDFATDTKNISTNVNLKKNAVRQLLQSANQKLSISETDDLASEILGDVCPARWRTHVKATLQLLYGNSGLIIMDTMNNESNNVKRNAVISLKDNFIVVSITSTWCLKEDPGMMSLLQRGLDPEKTIATVHVRYVSVFYNKPLPSKKFEPGIFVETFVQTGSQNRRRASQTLRATQVLCGVPLTPMSTCWLTNQALTHDSPVSATRLSPDPGDSKKNSSSDADTKTKESDGKLERKTKKTVVLEIKEGDSSSEDDRSSDNDDSVKDVIHMLSGSRPSARKRHVIRTETRTEPDTDELSKATDEILDAGTSDIKESRDPLIDSFPNVQVTSGSANESSQPVPQYSMPAYPNPMQTQRQGNPQYQQQQKSQTLPGAPGRLPPEKLDSNRSSASTLPMQSRELWSSPFTQMNPPQRPMNVNPLGVPSRHGSPDQFGPYFNPSASSSPFSGVSPSISPRPNFNLAQTCAPSNQYNTWSHSKEFNSLMAPQTGNVGDGGGAKDVLQSMKSLSLNQNLLTQQRMNGNMGFPNQRNYLPGVPDKTIAPPQNTNNNNMGAGFGIRNSRSLPHPGLHQFGDALSRSITAPNDVNVSNFRPELSRSSFQSLFQKENEMPGMKNPANSANVAAANTLGPIGSQRRVEQGPSLQQIQNNNTWPFLPGFGDTDDGGQSFGGDHDYQQFLAAVARNANQQRHVQTSAQNFDSADADEWNKRILWENQGSDQPPLEIFTGSSGGLRDFRSEGNEIVNSSDLALQMVDSSKGGTWSSAWQPWTYGGDNTSKIWHWGSEASPGDGRNE